MGKRHFYAKYDWFQMGSKEPGNGFVNSKGAIAFDSLEKRDKFIEDNKDHDYSCCAITRQEALKFIDWLPCSSDEKGLKLNSLEGNDYLTLKYYD